MQQSWNKKQLFSRAENLRKIINRFNEYCFWICTMILQSDKLLQRINQIEYFIDMALHLRKLNNFNCLMGVISALRSISIVRLVHTVENISYQHEDILKQLDELLSSENAFKNYRQALQDADVNCQPAIPFFGIHLTDLTFLDETRNNYDEFGNYCRSKMETMAKPIMDLLRFQTRPYKLKPVEGLQVYFKNYPALDGDALYELSLSREPKGCKYDELD